MEEYIISNVVSKGKAPGEDRTGRVVNIFILRVGHSMVCEYLLDKEGRPFDPNDPALHFFVTSPVLSFTQSENKRIVETVNSIYTMERMETK